MATAGSGIMAMRYLKTWGSRIDWAGGEPVNSEALNEVHQCTKSG
jgi:hypothetical protein